AQPQAPVLGADVDGVAVAAGPLGDLDRPAEVGQRAAADRLPGALEAHGAVGVAEAGLAGVVPVAVPAQVQPGAGAQLEHPQRQARAPGHEGVAGGRRGRAPAAVGLHAVGRPVRDGGPQLGHGGEEVGHQARAGAATGRGVVGGERRGPPLEHQPVHRAEEAQRQRGGQRLAGPGTEHLGAHAAGLDVGGDVGEELGVERGTGPCARPTLVVERVGERQRPGAGHGPSPTPAPAGMGSPRSGQVPWGGCSGPSRLHSSTVTGAACMLLESIQNPADLRDLTYDQLERLAREIRERIVEAVSANGGHLGSNLGVVELTIAMHRVFDSPRDVLLWDTGHQAYVHKMLTGRSKAFATLRQAGGLSGYPSRAESEHDWVENSHASTILCYAHGLSEAFKLQGVDDRRIVAVIGDGSLTGGMAFEGLNNLGHSGSRAVIILNDNGRSYAPTVSKLGESLSRLRLNPSYVRNRARLDKLLSEVPLVGEHLERGMDGALAALREIFEPPAFFEMLGVRYTGPFDGHDIPGLERALRNASEFDGPIVVHVLTQKGRGYAPAENDPIKRLHDTSEAKPGSYTAAFTEAIIKEAEHRPEVVAITAAMPDSTG